METINYNLILVIDSIYTSLFIHFVSLGSNCRTVFGSTKMENLLIIRFGGIGCVCLVAIPVRIL